MRPWPGIPEVEVSLDFGIDGSIKVGTLAVSGNDIYFAYDRSFIDRDALNPSPFHMRFDELPQRLVGPEIGGMFADALPDGWTRTIIDRRLAEQNFDPRSLSALDRLALVGGNGVGALSFRPTSELPDGVPPLTLDDLAATVRAERRSNDAGLVVAEKLAGSLGGARPKASIWFDGDRVSAEPVEGADPWIVKFPSPTFDAPDAGMVEYAYSLMASAAGIKVMGTRLLAAESGNHYFATERFDRISGRHYHFQSFAGLENLVPPCISTYYALLELDRTLTGAAEVNEELIRRMAFNALAKNRDDHVRNHGFLMNASGVWVASPAYDVTFEPINSHCMVIGASASDPSISDIGDVVRMLDGDGDRAEAIARDVRDVVAEFPKFAQEAGLDAARIREIDGIVKSGAAWSGGDPDLAAMHEAMKGPRSR